MPDYGHDLRFGAFLTPDAGNSAHVLELARVCDTVGLDLVSVQDHPYQARPGDARHLDSGPAGPADGRIGPADGLCHQCDHPRGTVGRPSRRTHGNGAGCPSSAPAASRIRLRGDPVRCRCSTRVRTCGPLAAICGPQAGGSCLRRLGRGTALAEDVPIIICNPGDFEGIEGLEVRPVPHPDR
jgi:hypothetical protein